MSKQESQANALPLRQSSELQSNTEEALVGAVRTVDDSLETRMLSALEIFHYESRFRNQLFVLALEPEVSLSSIITDLRVLQASDIRIIALCMESDALSEELERWNLRGGKFSELTQDLDQPLTAETPKHLREQLKENAIPVLMLKSTKEHTRASAAQAIALHALEIAERLKGLKVFLLSTFRGLEVDGQFQSHPSEDDVTEFLNGTKAINIGREQLAFIRDQNRKRRLEIVLLDAKSGSLFQEIFTHRGRGTLFTKDYPNIVRRGELRDVTEISLLMKPSITTGSMLPMSEDKIAEHIHEFLVYTINGAIVASAWLVDYGEWVEAAKICTLPRFQGKGRARQLVLQLIEEAKKVNKRLLFSLSVEARMWQFFESLGFEEIPREHLPAKWLENYNLSRPSKAFVYRIL